MTCGVCLPVLAIKIVRNTNLMFNDKLSKKATRAYYIMSIVRDSYF